MKRIVPLLVILGFLLVIYLEKTSDIKEAKKQQKASSDQPPVESKADMMAGSTEVQATTNKSVISLPQKIAAQPDLSPATSPPSEFAFTLGPLKTEHPNFLSLVATVSNAVLSVDRILKTRKYQLHKYSRSIWLTSEDKASAVMWGIFPSGTNALVGSVEATAYRETSFLQTDPSKSFRMSFYPETGVLREFSWGDSHETLAVYTNGPFSADYSRRLEGSMSLEMRWDANGKLVSSNVYNWATRGRVIDATTRSNKSTCRLGPTSALEAATGAWRQNNE